MNLTLPFENTQSIKYSRKTRLLQLSHANFEIYRYGVYSISIYFENSFGALLKRDVAKRNRGGLTIQSISYFNDGKIFSTSECGLGIT